MDKKMKVIEADCLTCAVKQLQEVGGLFNDEGLFLKPDANYSRCGDKLCPCADFHENTCVNGVKAK